MRKVKLIGFLLTYLFMMQACAQTTEKAYHLMLKGMYKNTVPFIKANELDKQLLKPSAKPVLLDTRTSEEFNTSHIKSARLTDPDNFSVGQLKGVAKDTPIVVYCSVGYRSERIGEQLKQAGYKNVYNLYGGIFEWVNKGYPVYNKESLTNKVHAYSRSWGIWLTKGEKVYE
jgi:rhodanese-related sulfurtransferase